jgi:HK97 family phage major capsid protein
MSKELLDMTTEIKDAAFNMRETMDAHGDRLDALEKLAEAQPTTPQGAKRGGLISAILIAAGRQPLAGYERVASEIERLPGGEVSIPWSYLSQPQAALTRSHLEGENLQLLPDMMQTLRESSIVPNLGIRMLNGGQQGDIVLPILSGSSAGWSADGADLPDLGEATTTATLSPSRAGAIVGLTSQTMATTDIGALESSLAADMSSAIGAAVDSAFLSQTATSNGIVGLSGVAATAVSGTNGSAVSQALLDGQLNALDTALIPAKNWIVHPSMARHLSAIPAFTGATTPLYENGMLRGIPVVTSQHVATNGSKGSASNLHSVFASDFSRTCVGAYWRTPTIEIGTRSDDFQKGSISMRIQVWMALQAIRTTGVSRISHYSV